MNHPYFSPPYNNVYFVRYYLNTDKNTIPNFAPPHLFITILSILEGHESSKNSFYIIDYMNKLLTERADSLFNKANSLKKKFSFDELAKKIFGDFNYTGSSVTNLMSDPDIDSNIVVPSIRNRKNDILHFADQLTEIKECRKVILYNRLYESIPYFVINVERFSYEDETWTITFFIQENDFHGTVATTNKINGYLSSNDRDLLLELKDYRLSHKLKRKVSSALIYEAVIDQGINNIEGFKSFLQDKGIDPEVPDSE